MDWTRAPDVNTLLIYGLLAVVVLWVIGICIGSVVEARRSERRWRDEDARLKASMEAALRELDEHEQCANRAAPPQ